MIQPKDDGWRPTMAPYVTLNKVARCAAEFGGKYSLASGIEAAASALGSNSDNGFVNTVFGNDISALSMFSMALIQEQPPQGWR